VLFELVKGMVTGKAPQIGDVKEIPVKNRRTGSVRARRPPRDDRP